MFDIFLFSNINGLAFKYFWVDVLVIFLAKYLPFVLLGALLLFLLKDYKKYFVMVSSAVISSALVTIVVKLIRFFLYRPRPFVALSVTPLIEHTVDGSLPSLHTAFFFALATAVFLHNKKAGAWFFAGSCLIAISRIIAGLHWPSDIIIGAALGIICALLVKNLLTRLLIGGKQQ